MIVRFLRLLRTVVAKTLAKIVFSRPIRIESAAPLLARKDFFTLITRPTLGITELPFRIQPLKARVGIVVQGPMLTSNRFTLNTLASYKAMFPEAKIILSTWPEEEKAHREILKKMEISTVVSDPPSNPGFANTNLQMVSTHNGVKRAQELGMEFILKTRADQRIYNHLALHFLLNMLSANPLEIKQAAKQESRLIFSSMGSLLYRLYGPSDMLMFARVSDALDYWSGELSPTNSTSPAPSLRGYAKQRPPEVWFCTRWLERLGYDLDWSLEQYWEVVAQRLLIVDSSALNLYWPKYSSYENPWRTYSSRNAYEEISYSHWLSLKFRQIVRDDDLLDLPIFES